MVMRSMYDFGHEWRCVPPPPQRPAFQVLCEMKKHPLLHTIPVAMLSGLQDESLGERAAHYCILLLLVSVVVVVMMVVVVVVVVAIVMGVLLLLLSLS